MPACVPTLGADLPRAVRPPVPLAQPCRPPTAIAGTMTLGGKSRWRQGGSVLVRLDDDERLLLESRSVLRVLDDLLAVPDDQPRRGDAGLGVASGATRIVRIAHEP